LNINFLKTFITAASHSSFSEAADILHLTQPAVSRQIAALEQDLGVRLFDRIGRRVQLTEAGAILLPKAQHLLDIAADMRRAVSSLGDEVSGNLVMGTSHHIGLHRLPPVLRDFSRLYPMVDLDIRFLGSEAVCAAVTQGALEMGVVTLPAEASEQLRTVPLWDDPLRVVVSLSHPLSHETPVELSTLLEYPAILPSRGTFTRDMVERTIAPTELRIETRLSTDYLETLKMLVSVGLGWSMLPATLLGPELKTLDIPELRLTRSLGAIFHHRRTLSNAARAMLELCQSNTR
jgi:DNA-binding transcriptional LysR family regulator